MQTVKVEISKKYIIEFLHKKWGAYVDGKLIISVPPRHYFSHTIKNLTTKIPKGKFPKGNAEILLRREHGDIGKDYRWYFYLSKNSMNKVNHEAYEVFWIEACRYIQKKIFIENMNITEAIEAFLQEYEIFSISMAAMRKHFQRNHQSFKK